MYPQISNQHMGEGTFSRNRGPRLPLNTLSTSSIRVGGPLRSIVNTIRMSSMHESVITHHLFASKIK